MKTSLISHLKIGVAPIVLGVALLAAPAYAQSAPAKDKDAAEEDAGTIVVTGSILRRTTTETVSPVTSVTADALDKRAINTIQDGLQQLVSNNGPALTNSFTANGAFAAGASAVSLRGLSTNSTLVLFDGLRAAYYPLADDGSRNFVDLNTIPDDIVEKIDVLRDGASSAYGADAIAGVVNIITKKQFKGLSARAEAGISSRGDAGQRRFTLTAGVGDLEKDGFNVYVSGFYYKSDKLMNADRPYPYNSDDLRSVCAPDGTCGPNNVLGGLDAGGVYRAGTATASTFYVRPANAGNTAAVAGSRNQALNLANCAGTLYTLTAAELALAANATAPTTVCQVDYTKNYGVINPNIERYGFSTKGTAKINDSIEAYVEFNFMQSKVSYTGFPSVFRGAAPTGIFFPQFSTADANANRAAGSGILALPIYICPRTGGVSATLVNGVATTPGCTAANGTLNPNNPFAAAGNVARIVGRDLNHVTYNETRNRAFRGALGVNGQITDKIGFDVGFTAMHVDLRRTQDGYANIQHLIDVIADGSYNFRNPSATPQATLDYLYPTNITNATSDQVQLQATLNGSFGQLPGGAISVAVGGTVRYEAVDAPSANSDINGPTQRYFTLNAFGTKGSRWISSGFAEIEAPILPVLTANVAGRYDHYSSGQNAFSPKFGLKFKPIREILLRATYSKGFRIPSFGEANALPTTGFVSNTAAAFTDTFLAQYSLPGATCSKATFAQCPTYIRSGSYGQTTLASPNLKPEKSESFTAGVVFEPMRNLSLTIDYYHIKKTEVITQPSNAPALTAYYSGAAIPAGYTVIADAPDVNFPNARPRIAFVQSGLINATSQTVSGLDFNLEFTHQFGPSLKWSTSLDASYIIKLESDLTAAGGGVERYDGTLGNFNLTAGSGTPKWRGNWVNSFTWKDKYTLTATANYFGGYDISAMDQGTGYKDCGLNPGYSPTGCGVPKYITLDLNTQIKVTPNFTFYMSMLNAFDKLPPIDVETYGAHMYNPVQGGNGILGRYFRAGAKVSF